MPKMKTNRAAAKRLRVTGSGRIFHRTAHAGHLFKSKTRSRQVRLKGNREVAAADRKQSRRLLGL